MSSIFYPRDEIAYQAHPKFPNVKLAVLITGQETEGVSVSMLEIAIDAEIPVHTHDPQVDSILVTAGRGEAYVNGKWRPIARGDYLFVPGTVEHGVRNTGAEPLKLFVHHSPPLL
jgi:quercetin dioxygenase-like cupin family protein